MRLNQSRRLWIIQWNLVSALQRCQPVSAVEACFMRVEPDFQPQSSLRSCNTVPSLKGPFNQSDPASVASAFPPTLPGCFRSVASVFRMSMPSLLQLPVVGAPSPVGDFQTLLQAKFSTRTVLLEHLMLTADTSVWDREHVSVTNCVIIDFDFAVLQHNKVIKELTF